MPRFVRGGRGLMRDIKNGGGGGLGGLLALIFVGIIIIVCVLAPIGHCYGEREKEKRQQELAEKQAQQEQESLRELNYLKLSWGDTVGEYNGKWQFKVRGTNKSSTESLGYVYAVLTVYDENENAIYTDFCMCSLGIGKTHVFSIFIPKTELPKFSSFSFEKAHKKPYYTGKLS